MRFLLSALLSIVLVFRLHAGELTPADLTALPKADVVILGEVHDNPVHHTHQARAVAALAPKALVFEMLTEAQAEKVLPGIRGDAAALAEALHWQGGGWPPFALYHPIFTAAPDARVYGGALPRTDVRRAVSDRAARVFGAEATAYGLADALPEDQQVKRNTLQMEAHCNALPESLLPGMVEAQRLRDAALARAVLQALREVGAPVVLITGNGHGRKDWGVPPVLARVAPEVTVFSLAQFEETPWPDAPFDGFLLTKAAEREDPCAVFNKN